MVLKSTQCKKANYPKAHAHSCVFCTVLAYLPTGDDCNQFSFLFSILMKQAICMYMCIHIYMLCMYTYVYSLTCLFSTEGGFLCRLLCTALLLYSVLCNGHHSYSDHTGRSSSLFYLRAAVLCNAGNPQPLNHALPAGRSDFSTIVVPKIMLR